MPAVFKKLSHSGTKLIRASYFLEETGNDRVLGKGRKICWIDQTVPMGFIAVFSKQPVGFNNKLGWVRIQKFTVDQHVCSHFPEYTVS